MITGQCPTDIENDWSQEDVAMTLLTFNAREAARHMIAANQKIPLEAIYIPVTVIQRSDGKEKTTRRVLGRQPKKNDANSNR